MKRKSGFLTFCLAFCPGAGQMYQGYMKRGTSLVVLFMLIIMLGTLLNMTPVALFALVVWMYSFFDTFNIRSRIIANEPMEPDAWLVDPASLAGGNWKTLVEKRHRVLGIALVAIGAYALYSNFIAPVLWGFVYAYEMSWRAFSVSSSSESLPSPAATIISYSPKISLNSSLFIIRARALQLSTRFSIQRV